MNLCVGYENISKKYRLPLMLRSYAPHQLERVIRAIRRFFEQQGFHEIIPPVMTATIPLEPNLYPFTTDWHVSTPAQRFFLATSPERSLKHFAWDCR